MLVACGSVMPGQFLRDQPVRIGIDLHQGVELHNNEIYGPVVAAAHEMESRVAQYPRVVVGKAVFDYLKWASKKPQYDPVSRYKALLCQECKSLLIDDFDGQWIVDYLGDYFRAIVFSQVSLLPAGSSILDAYNCIKRQIIKCSESKNTKLALRYLALLDYFEERLPDWGFQPVKESEPFKPTH